MLIENGDGDDGVGRKKREEDRETEEERAERETANTFTLARTTLKITIGCPSHCQTCTFKTFANLAPTKKTCPTVRLSGPCFKTGRTRSEKKTHARGDTCTSRERSHSRVPLDRERLQGPSMPDHLNLIATSFSGQRLPVFTTDGDCSSSAWLSISSSSWESGAVDVPPDMGLMLPRPWTTN